MNKDFWMLDTNTISYLFREPEGAIAQRLEKTALNSVCISVITEAELLYGVRKNPQAKTLKQLISAFLIRVTTLPWTSEVATVYASLRAELESRGLSQGNMDLMIASHAKTSNAVLVTSDQTLLKLDKYLDVSDWRAG